MRQATGLAHSFGKRLAIRTIAGCILVLGGSATVFELGGYRINTTPSFPLGLWQIEPMPHGVAVGDTVFICPPPNDPLMKSGRDRGYLHRGALCPGGFAPLIKTIVATAGQKVMVSGGQVFVDGVRLLRSAILARDGEGRAMRAYSGGIVPPGFVFIHADFVASYDSRYFGPIPAKGILGLAEPVFTLAP